MSSVATTQLSPREDATTPRYSEPRDEFDLDIPDEGILSQHLPPVDGGKKAWTFIFAVFMIEALCWGFPQSYGVFQEYYVGHEHLSGSGVSLVGTLSSGIIYMSGPICFPLANRYPRQRQLMQWSGLVLFCTGCVLASFATKLYHLILTQGLLCGIGSALLYSPGVVLMNEWWVEKRGTAMGIMYSGTGVTGVVVPLLCNWLLDNHGFRTALRVWAIVMFVLSAAAISAVTGRLPIPARNPPRPRGSHPSIHLRILKSPMFILLAQSNLLQALGHFVSPLYLPLFAAYLNLPAVRGTSLVSVLNGSTVFGRLISGYLSDKIDLSMPMFLSSGVSGIAALAMWGESRGYATLIAFAVVFGIWSGGWSVLWSRFCTAVVKDQRDSSQRESWSSGEEAEAIAGMYGALSLGRGIGNVVTGPISDRLLVGNGGDGEATKGMYGLGRYEALVVMTGAIMIGSACVAVGGRFWRKVTKVGALVRKVIGKR